MFAKTVRGDGTSSFISLINQPGKIPRMIERRSLMSVLMDLVEV